MFPYFQSARAAQAVEDGAVLGTLFGNLQRKEDIRDRLLVYEQLRRPRATKVRDMSIENAQIFHMLDCARDNSKDGRQVTKISPNGLHNNWADAGFRNWLFGHDVVKEAEGMRESMNDRLKDCESEISP